MKPYVIRQGEYLASLAVRHGFDAERVWHDPANGALAQLRRNPQILQPGDVMHLPDGPDTAVAKQLRARSRNTYVARVPKVTLSLVFRDHGHAIANARYLVDVAGRSVAGSSDGDGKLELAVPVHVTEVRVDFPERHRAFVVCVGHMDPIEERSGLRARLEHLGYLQPVSSESSDPNDGIAAALTRFQRHHGLHPSGTFDDLTRDRLRDQHGS